MSTSKTLRRDAPGARHVTLRDVALLAGVDKGTVSVALNGAGGNTGVSATTRARIVQVARELGYEPNLQAQRLANGQSHDQVGMLCPAFEAGTVLLKNQHVQRLLSRYGFEVPLYAFDSAGLAPGSQHHLSTPLSLLQRMRRMRPRAIMCNTGQLSREVLAELESCRDQGIVTVCYDHPLPAPPLCDSVLFDREDNTYQAARHLVELGHERLGLFVVGTPQPDDTYALPRQRGFARALSEAGLSFSPDWMQHGGPTESSGKMLAHWFLGLNKSNRPTGLCIVNEIVALCFLHEVRRHGVRVPQDLSIVSHDDLPIAEFAEVPLTTVSQPVEEIAGHAVELLLSRLQGQYDGAPRQIIVRGTLVVRESALAPGGA